MSSVLSNATSSFDTVVEEVQKPNQSTQSTENNDATNQSGNEDLLKNLTKMLSSNNDDEGQEKIEKVDYSLLLGKEQPKPKDTTTSNDDGKSTVNTVTDPTPPTENEFIKQLNDDKVIGTLLDNIKPATFELSKEILESFDDEGNVTLTPELLSHTIGQATALSHRQTMSQTIDLIRELVPAITEMAEASALTKFANNQEVNKALSSFGENNTLKDLALALSKGKEIKDGESFAKSVKSLMHDINKAQLDKNEEENPAPKGLETFLDSI